MLNKINFIYKSDSCLLFSKYQGLNFRMRWQDSHEKLWNPLVQKRYGGKIPAHSRQYIHLKIMKIRKKTTSEIIFFFFYESDKIKNKLSIQNSNIPIHMPFFTLLLHTLCFYTCCAIKSIVLIFVLFFVHYKCTKNIRSNKYQIHAITNIRGESPLHFKIWILAPEI